MTTVYASTATLRGKQPLHERIGLFRAHGIENIELGDGAIVTGPFNPSTLPDGGCYMIHNYFPQPPDPFILNLASADPVLRARSITLVRDALRYTAALRAPAYTVHAGFITDPDLSFVFPTSTEPDAAARALSRFVGSIKELLPDAEEAGVRLLIENNVCWEAVRGTLLLQTPDEFAEFFGHVSHPLLGILVDTGHLNVSAHTFGFDRLEFLRRHADRIGAFHLHDNDGTADQHLPVTPQSWVASVLRSGRFSGIPWIAEAKFSRIEDVAGQIAFLKDIARGSAA